MMVMTETGDHVLGTRIQAARVGAGLSVGDLASRARIASDRLAMIEAGDPIATVELDAVAAAFDLPVDEFLRPAGDSLDVWLRLGDGSTAGTREAVKVLARFTADYEFLLSLEA